MPAYRSFTMAALFAVLPVFLLTCGGGTSVPANEEIETVRHLFDNGYFADAESRGRALREQLNQRGEKESLEMAEAAELLAKAMRENGKSRDAETLQLAKQAVELKTRILGDPHAGVASSLYELGFLYWKLGQLQEAWDTLERALRIQEEMLGPSHPDVARTLITLGSLHFSMKQDGDGAMDYFDRARLIQDRAQSSEPQDVAWRLRQQGFVHCGLMEYEEAVSLFKQELKICRTALREGHPYTGTCQNHVGQLLWVLGDYANARRHLEKGLAIGEKALGPDHPNVGHDLFSLANLLKDMGDQEGARLRYEHALKIYKEKLGENHASTASCLKAIADVLSDLGETEKARTYYEQTLALCDNAGEAWNPLKAEVLVSYGMVVQRMGEIEKAREIYQKASALVENAFGTDHPLMIAIMQNQAIILNGNRDYRGALALFDHVLSFYEAAPDQSPYSRISTLLNMALCHAGLGDRARAMDKALRAEQVARDQFTAISRSLEERLALKYASIGTLALYLTASMAADSDEERADRLARAFDRVIHWRALCLDEMVARRQAAREANDPRITALQKELRRAREHVSRIAVSGKGSRSESNDNQRMEKARERKEKAERRLAEASLAFRRELKRAPAGLAEVKRSLPENSALVAFFRYEEDLFKREETSDLSAESHAAHAIRGLRERGAFFSYMAFILKGKEAGIRAVKLGRAEEIEAVVEQWRSELLRGSGATGPATHLEERYHRAGRALRQKIWDPVAALLDGIPQVFIVPDGVLHLVNLGALPDEAGSYLMEAGPLFHCISAERDLTEVNKKAEAGRKLLVVGNPAFGERTFRRPASKSELSDSLEAQYEKLYFDRLPQTAKESEIIVSLWRRRDAEGNDARGGASVVSLMDEAATEAGFKAEAPGKRVLHLATHGFFLDPAGASGMDHIQSTGMPGSGLREDPGIKFSLGENPLLRAGLALAQANARRDSGSIGEDGILTAEEIAGMDLTGVAWVVLSGCDTGRGSIQAGEGVFGLQRAFQLAGVRSVVMSLWPVEDRAARLWMQAFYTAKLEGKKTIAAAVRAASLAVLEQRRREGRSSHPFFWSPFIATGDWR